MRVLCLNPFSQAVSGADESLVTLLRFLRPLGVVPHVVLPSPGPYAAAYEAAGAQVHYCRLTTLKRRPDPLAVAAMPFGICQAAIALARLVRRERIDLIHTNMEVVLDGAVVSRALGLPHLLHYRGNTLDKPRLAFDVLTRFWVATSERVVCISRGTARIFEKRGYGAVVEAQYDPVDLAPFRDGQRCQTTRNQLGAGDGDVLVGNVARIHPRKDLETFLRACALVAREHSNARFVIVGNAEGSEESVYELRLRALAQELGIARRTTFAGARRDMPSVMAALDVLVLSSRHEGFGRVLPEAMAAGRAIVASREGAPAELVEHGRQGFLAEPAAPAHFAEHLGALVASSSLRAQLGEEGRRRAPMFDGERAAAAMLRTYRTCAELRLRRSRPD